MERNAKREIKSERKRICSFVNRQKILHVIKQYKKKKMVAGAGAGAGAGGGGGSLGICPILFSVVEYEKQM